MTLNELMTKLNVITKLALGNNGKEVSKELKVKIMKIRIAYSKVRKSFDEDCQEFINSEMTEKFKQLRDNQARTEEETKEFNELVAKINSEYEEYVGQRMQSNVDDEDYSLTLDEYSELLDINSSGIIEFNNQKIPAVDFMQFVYELFVKE